MVERTNERWPGVRFLIWESITASSRGKRRGICAAYAADGTLLGSANAETTQAAYEAVLGMLEERAAQEKREAKAKSRPALAA